MVKQSLYLTIDQGGHASRAILFDDRGKVQGEGYVDIATVCQFENQVEHDPEELINSIKDSILTAIDSVDTDQYRIVSAGLATQRSSIVCWDRKTGQALSPVISWQDRRAAKWLHSFEPHGAEIHKKTGLFITAHYGVSKLNWCLENIPAVAQASKNNSLACGPLASFILFRLLKQSPLLTDPANASRTLLWNMRTLDWDNDLIALFEIPKTLLPECVPTCFKYGHLTVGVPSVDEENIPLTIVTGDQSAALFAYGEPDQAAVYVNIGTGAFVQRVFSRLHDYSPKLLTSVVSQIEQKITYVLEGTVNGAGSAFVEVENQLGIDPAQAQIELEDWLSRNDEVPLYLNGVSGLGSPYWVADFKSEFVGAGEDWQKIVAVAESIVFLIMVNLMEMEKIHSPAQYIIVTGGLSKNTGLCQRLADLSTKKVFRPEECEATARGVAYQLLNKKDGRPENSWSDENKGRWFRPEENKGFVARYARWKQEMSKAISLLDSSR